MTSRKGFERYRKENPMLRYGQAFCNYFKATDPILYYSDDEASVRQECEFLMDMWQIPEGSE